jgi:DNA-directed RNA polymerase sigma subunit (sigma70/sigma32)
MAHAAAWPIFTAELGLTRYLEELGRLPMLQQQEAYLLAKRWREHGDCEAAPGAIISAISARCRFIASVLQAGRIRAAPLPSFGQTAPKM